MNGTYQLSIVCRVHNPPFRSSTYRNTITGKSWLRIGTYGYAVNSTIYKTVNGNNPFMPTEIHMSIVHE